MLRVGKMADYALVIMCTMASQPTGLIPMEYLAQSTRLSLSTVRKLMRLLVNAGLVKSVRGIKGGYQLARMPQTICISHILAAVDGPVAITDCCSDDASCELSGDCEMEPHWSIINQLVGQLLAVISLADLCSESMGPRVDLPSLLQRVAQNPQVMSGVGLCDLG
jgi:FeS assembly SUF system regulator